MFVKTVLDESEIEILIIRDKEKHLDFDYVNLALMWGDSVLGAVGTGENMVFPTTLLEPLIDALTDALNAEVES